MIEEIRKICSDDNIKEMACEYTGAEEEYQGFILGCNVLADEIEQQVKNCYIPDVSVLSDLIDWCFDNCNASNSDRLHEILDKLDKR